MTTTRTGRNPLPADQRRTAPVLVRLTFSERAQLTEQARRAGKSVSDLLRSGVGLAESGRPQRDPVTYTRKAHKEEADE